MDAYVIQGLIKNNQPLPSDLTKIDGSVDLTGYNLPLPDSLTIIGWDVFLRGYNFPLPEKLKVRGKIIK